MIWVNAHWKKICIQHPTLGVVHKLRWQVEVGVGGMYWKCEWCANFPLYVPVKEFLHKCQPRFKKVKKLVNVVYEWTLVVHMRRNEGFWLKYKRLDNLQIRKKIYLFMTPSVYHYPMEHVPRIDFPRDFFFMADESNQIQKPPTYPKLFSLNWQT